MTATLADTQTALLAQGLTEYRCRGGTSMTDVLPRRDVRPHTDRAEPPRRHSTASVFVLAADGDLPLIALVQHPRYRTATSRGR